MEHKNPQTQTHTHTQCTYRISGINTRLEQQTPHALTLTYFSPALSLPFGLPVLHEPSLLGRAVLCYWFYFGDFSPYFGAIGCWVLSQWRKSLSLSLSIYSLSLSPYIYIYISYHRRRALFTAYNKNVFYFLLSCG
jgi:hypothetical protein